MNHFIAHSNPITNPYLRLMRLHQPVGIWLVFWPCALAVAFAGGGALTLESLRLLCLLFAGSAIARGAGCVINDMADRRFDAQVARTRSRPLASGELSMPQAALFLTLVTLAGLLLLVQFPLAAILTALPAAFLVIAYPFMKRITWWPQAFLGLTFNWGVFISWVAVADALPLAAYLLYAACVFWTLGYDTIYGFQDKKDDAAIGVKSTSRRLEQHAKKWLLLFYGAAWLLFGATLFLPSPPQAVLAWAGLLWLAAHFAWQIMTLNPDDPQNCQERFFSNAGAPLGVFLLPIGGEIYHILANI